MKEHIVLRTLDKIKSLYTSMGVDYEKMRLILKYKLTMDNRRTSTVLNANNANNAEKKEKNNFRMSLFMYAFFGLFIGIITFIPMNIMYVYTMLFSIFMFLVLTIFISDFSTVLLDVRDSNLIRITGVDSKTLNAAKITHIVYYVFMVSMALGWLATIGSFRKGILIGILFLLSIMIIDVFMIVVTALVYYSILKYFNGEKIKDIINFVQIILTVTMIVGYQLIPRLFQFTNLDVSYSEKIWNILVPPMWFAAPIYALDYEILTGTLLALIFMAIIIPLTAIMLYTNKSKQFENYLSKLNANDGEEKKKRKGIVYKLGHLFCRSSEEKAVYDFSSSLIKNERDFKLRVYPNLGFLFIFPFLFMLITIDSHSMGTFAEWKNNIANSNSYLYIYFFILMFGNILSLVQFSTNYKAAWIYISAPIKNKNNIYKGCYKAVFANLILPLFIVQSIAFIWLFGLKIILDLIVVIEFAILVIPIQHLFSNFKLPFSVKVNVTDSSQGLLVMFISFVIAGAGAFIHFTINKNIFAIIIYILVLTILNIVMWNKAIVFKNKVGQVNIK